MKMMLITKVFTPDFNREIVHHALKDLKETVLAVREETRQFVTMNTLYRKSYRIQVEEPREGSCKIVFQIWSNVSTRH